MSGKLEAELLEVQDAVASIRTGLADGRIDEADAFRALLGAGGVRDRVDALGVKFGQACGAVRNPL